MNTIKAVREALKDKCPSDIIKYKMEPLLKQKRKTPKAPKKKVKTNKNNNHSLKPRTLF